MDFDDFAEFEEGDMNMPPSFDPNIGIGDLPVDDMEANDGFSNLPGMSSDFTGIDTQDFDVPMDNLGSFSNIDKDFGNFDSEAFSTASLPPLDSIGTSMQSAPPAWSPNDNLNTFGSTNIQGTGDTRLTSCCCVLAFCILLLIMIALIGLSIAIVVLLSFIKYDVNHLTLTIEQDVNPAPSTLPPQIIPPY